MIKTATIFLLLGACCSAKAQRATISIHINNQLKKIEDKDIKLYFVHEDSIGKHIVIPNINAQSFLTPQYEIKDQVGYIVLVYKKYIFSFGKADIDIDADVSLTFSYYAKRRTVPVDAQFAVDPKAKKAVELSFGSGSARMLSIINARKYKKASKALIDK